MEDECSVKNNQKASEITVITCALASVMLVSMIVFMDPVCRPSMLVFDVFVTIESMGLILFSSISFFQKKKELVYLDNEKFED